MQSGLNYEQMGAVDRMMMKILSMFIAKKKNKSESEEGLEQAIKNSYDVSSKDFIVPLIEFVREKQVLGQVIGRS